MKENVDNKKKLSKSLTIIAVITVLFTAGNFVTVTHASAPSATPESPAITKTVSKVAHTAHNQPNQNQGNTVNFNNLTSMTSAKSMVMSGDSAMQSVLSNVKNLANNPSRQGLIDTKNSMITEFQSNPSLREMIYLTLAIIIGMYIYIKYRVRAYLYN